MHIGINYFDAKNGQIEEALKGIGILGWIRQATLCLHTVTYAA
jgi:hypothetical protein